MKKLMGMALLLASVAGFGCGGSSISNFRMQLAPGAIRRSEVLVVVPVDASRTVFEGDYSDDPPSVAQGRITLQTSYAPRLAAAMQAAGLRALVRAGGAPRCGVHLSAGHEIRRRIQRCSSDGWLWCWCLVHAHCRGCPPGTSSSRRVHCGRELGRARRSRGAGKLARYTPRSVGRLHHRLSVYADTLGRSTAGRLRSSSNS